MRALLVLAILGDTLTFLLLPSGAEANPLVLAVGPVVAITLRWLAVVGLLLTIRWTRHANVLLACGILAGGIGLGSNLSVLVR